MSTGTLYLVFIQVASRLLTFAGNQILLRFLSPSLLGLAVQLEILSVTILYTSRESLRVALQRPPTVQEPTSGKVPNKKTLSDDEARTARSQQTINIAYLTWLVGLAASVVFGYGYIRKSNDEVLQAADFWLAFQIYGLATVVEFIAEPCFVIIQQRSLYKARARAETGAAIARVLAACLTAYGMQKVGMSASVMPFAIGQLCYATTLLSFYLIAVLPISRAEHFSLTPRKVVTGETRSPSDYWLGLFPKPLISLAATFYSQSVFKLLLTQGDSLILSFITDLKSQGAFALASNYGGLLSRLLFQPVEESSRNVFGRLLASNGAVSPNSSKSEPKPHSTRQPHDEKVHDLRTKNITQAIEHLTRTLHLYTLFSLPIFTLLPHVFPVLITNLIGTRWSTPSTTALLSAYTYYLPFLAVNGILDAFVTSVATPTQLRHQSLIMIGVTLVYAFAAWIFMTDTNSNNSNNNKTHMIKGLNLGPSGLVWANIINMTLRIMYSIRFFDEWVTTNATVDQGNPTKTTTTPTKKRNWLPHWICTTTSLLTGIYLHQTITLDLTNKSFTRVKGLDSTDWTRILTAAVIQGTTILTFEHKFLSEIVFTALPESAVLKIQNVFGIKEKRDRME